MPPTEADASPNSVPYRLKCAKTCDYCDSQEFEDYIKQRANEQSCSMKEARELDCHHKCERICTDGLCVPTCTCDAGYEKHSDENPVCFDVNECLNNPCQFFQQCINLAGTYTCILEPS